MKTAWVAVTLDRERILAKERQVTFSAFGYTFVFRRNERACAAQVLMSESCLECQEKKRELDALHDKMSRLNIDMMRLAELSADPRPPKETSYDG
eukprot:4091211-Pyramimonas_sp.AAC.1